MSLHNQFILIFLCVQLLIYPTCFTHFSVRNMSPNTYLFCKSVYICLLFFFQIWPIISFLCVHFSLLSVMILFLIYHINCYFPCINIIGIDLLIGSMLFYKCYNLLRSLYCPKYLNFFQSGLLISSSDHSKNLFPHFDHF